jgi:hypothetical protein
MEFDLPILLRQRRNYLYSSTVYSSSIACVIKSYCNARYRSIAVTFSGIIGAAGGRGAHVAKSWPSTRFMVCAYYEKFLGRQR